MQTHLHTQEVVEQLANIDQFRVKWRSRKTDRHSTSPKRVCVFMWTSHSFISVHMHIYSRSVCNDYCRSIAKQLPVVNTPPKAGAVVRTWINRLAG